MVFNLRIKTNINFKIKENEEGRIAFEVQGIVSRA